MLFETLMLKLRKRFFSIFFKYFNFSSNSNITLKFYVVHCNNFEKSHEKDIKKSIHEIQTYANFSYICALKPVGRIDPSRFKRVKVITHVKKHFSAYLQKIDLRLREKPAASLSTA